MKFAIEQDELALLIERTVRETLHAVEADQARLNGKLSYSEVEAAELSEAVKGAVETANATSNQLIVYIRKEEIQAARGELRSLEDSMQETLLWESQNGENTISKARKDDIEDRIDDVEILIDCLDDGRDDCNA